jgi:hypothetical protein
MPKLKGLVFGEFDRHGEVADAHGIANTKSH